MVIVYSKYELVLISVRINCCLHAIILLEIWSLLGEYWKIAAHVNVNCRLYFLDSLFTICQWEKKAVEEDEEETAKYTMLK